MFPTASNLVCVAPAHTAEPLAEGVVMALTRKFSRRTYWGPLKTTLLGLVTGGLWPLVALPKRFRDAISAEQTHLWHFAEWIRLQLPCADTEKLRDAVATRLKFRWSLWIFSLVLAALAVAWAWRDLARLEQNATVITLGPFGHVTVMPLIEPFTPRFLFNFTARLPHVVKDSATMARVLLAAEGFALLLIAAHILSLWQIVAHVGDVRGVVEQYNALVHKRPELGMCAVRPPRAGVEIHAVWVACTIGVIVLGAWWSVPMLLAAAAQSRYIKTEGRQVRLALAAQAFNVLAERRPVLHLPLPSALRGKCVRDRCEAPINAGAQFCSRCGERVKVSV